MSDQKEKKYGSLRKFLEEKETKPEVIHEVLKRAMRQKHKARNKQQQESETLHALKESLGDLDLSEADFKHAFRAYENDIEEATKKKQTLTSAVQGLSVLAVIIVIGIYFVYDSKLSEFSDRRAEVMQVYSEVELQLDRAESIREQLQAMIESRDEFKSQKIGEVVAQTPTEKLPIVLSKYSSVLDDKAFLVLLTEVAGSINRITVAKRRYNKIRARFMRGLDSTGRNFLKDEPVPEMQKLHQTELKTGP